MNELRKILSPVHHGIAMGVLALIFGALWAAYMATHHEQLHGGFEATEAQLKQTHMQERMNAMKADMNMDEMGAGAMSHSHPSGTSEAHQHDTSAAHSEHQHSHEAGHQHSHSGSLAMDAMQRLLRGHIHFMGIGLLTIIMLILVASTSLKDCWKKVFGWTFGLGTLMYPPAWILMGFRTVGLGPEGAEASVMWLFGPAVALLIGSLIALFCVLAIESIGLKRTGLFSWAFHQDV